MKQVWNEKGTKYTLSFRKLSWQVGHSTSNEHIFKNHHALRPRILFNSHFVTFWCHLETGSTMRHKNNFDWKTILSRKLKFWIWTIGQHTIKKVNKIRGRSAWAIISFGVECPRSNKSRSLNPKWKIVNGVNGRYLLLCNTSRHRTEPFPCVGRALPGQSSQGPSSCHSW